MSSFEQFTKDTAEHQLEVLLDNGLYRHLSLRKLNTSNNSFSITTWPGYLCISGDMGCFTFQRTTDMFEFFRGAPGEIAPGYWSEKVQAGAGSGGARSITVEPDFSKYDKRMDEYLLDFIKELDASDPETSEKIEHAKEAVEDFKNQRENSEWDIVSRVNNWDSHIAGGMELEDFWDNERSLEKFQYHYIWCCYAIVHAIALYDINGVKNSGK